MESTRRIKRILCIIAVTAMIVTMIPSGFAKPDKASADDTRIKVSEIWATSDLEDIFYRGGKVQSPIINVTLGSPAHFDGNRITWQRLNINHKWENIYNGEFRPGIWRIRAQARIDGSDAATHVLASSATLEVDGRKWTKADSNDTEHYSYVEYYSPRISIDGDSFDEPGGLVSVKLCGHNDIRATWNKQAGISGYKVYYIKDGGEKFIYGGRTDRTTMTLKNLQEGVKYYVHVFPDEPAFTSIDMDELNSGGIYTLKKLNSPKVTKKSSSKVTVQWNNINGETGYQISRSTKKTGTNIVATCKTTTGKSTVLSVTKYKTYYYKVRAYKTVDGKKICGPWSSVKSYKLK